MKKTVLQKALLSGLVMTLLLLFVSVFSFAAELDEIKAAIEGKGAKWIAGETSVSKLSQEQRKLRVGLIKPSAAEAGQPISIAPLTEVTPPTLDWRHGGSRLGDTINYVTPVRDQGNCGSCWAFGATAALESYKLINNPDNTCGLGGCDLSEQTLVSCSKAGSCSGGYIDKASTYIKKTGLPSETCAPYTATNMPCKKACCYNWQSATEKINSWSWVAPTVTDIKNALTYGPLATTMNVYNDFFSYLSGIYSYTKGRLAGGHVVLIVGYDDDNECFIVKNSWGDDWGEAGYFRIAYSQLTSVVKFGQYSILYQ